MGVEFLSQVEKIGAESGDGLTLTEMRKATSLTLNPRLVLRAKKKVSGSRRNKNDYPPPIKLVNGSKDLLVGRCALGGSQNIPELRQRVETS